MLAAIRNFARSWVMKVLLAFLVLSFAIWGIGDVFTGGTGNAVAEVGELEVTASELDDGFTRSLRQLQQQTGQGVTRSEAIRFGLLDQALQSLVAQRLLDAEAIDLALTTSDQAVARLIAEEPAFRVDGRFDRERFQLLLRQNGLDEDAFAEQLRAERTRNALAGAVRPIGGLPTTLKDRLAERLAQQRTGTLLVVPAARFADIAAPDDATLQAFLAENEGRYRAPERRDVTAVLLSPELLVDEIAVDEDAIQARYEARIDTFTTPELRTVRQLRGSEEASVRDAYDRLRAGESPEAVVAAIDDVALSALGAVEEAALPAAFATPIFSAPGAGSITPPVESAFGWHVFLVDEIAPGEVRPFATVRADLEAELARELAAEQLPDLAVALDDALGGGATLEQAADDLALPLVRVDRIDRQGRGPDGEPAAALAAWGPLLSRAFEAPEGETSLLEETDDGRFFVYRVDAIEAARTLTLAEARDRIEADWRAAEALRRAREEAETVRADLEGTMSVDAAVTRYDLERRAVPAQTRTDRTERPAVQAALFATEPGGVAATVLDLADGAAVLVVDALTAIDEEVATATRNEVDSGFTRDLLAQFERALRRDHPIRVDRAAIDRLFAVDPDA